MTHLYIALAGAAAAFGIWQGNSLAGIFVWNAGLFLLWLVDRLKTKP
jgi:hypothetical protein